MSNFEIRIGNSLAHNGNQNPKCVGSYSLGKGETKRISCPSQMRGRYVNIRIPATGSAKQYLTLCEVEVYAQDNDGNLLIFWNTYAAAYVLLLLNTDFHAVSGILRAGGIFGKFDIHRLHSLRNVLSWHIKTYTLSQCNFTK